MKLQLSVALAALLGLSPAVAQTPPPAATVPPAPAAAKPSKWDVNAPPGAAVRQVRIDVDGDELVLSTTGDIQRPQLRARNQPCVAATKSFSLIPNIALKAMSGGIVFGTLLAMMRLSSLRPLAALAGGYVNLMRSVPLVLVIFWFFFLVPYIGAWLIGASRPIAVGAFWSAAITFTLFEAAYYCEIMRAGIQSIPRGQVWSGYALGLNYWQTMGQVVLPQAFRNMLPVLLTQTIVLFQDTSLVYVLSMPDFLGAASKVAQRDGHG